MGTELSKNIAYGDTQIRVTALSATHTMNLRKKICRQIPYSIVNRQCVSMKYGTNRMKYPDRVLELMC